MKQFLLGVDRGSTNVKAVLYNMMGAEVSSASLPLDPPHQEYAGWAEQDMAQLWERTVRAIRMLLEKYPICASQIAAIGFSGHGGGLYAIDEQGKPVRPCILSMDNRMAAENQRRKEAGLQVFQTSKVDPAILLYWLRTHEPETYDRIRWAMAAKDWIRYCMTGVPAISGSDFGMSALFRDGQLDPSAFTRLEIPDAADRIPPFRMAWEISGYVTEDAAAQTGLQAGTPCVMGGHDCALASFGVGGSRNGHLSAIMGTFAMNMLLADHCDLSHTSAYGRIVESVLPQKQMFMNSTSAGSSLDWFIRVFCPYEQQLAAQQKISVHTVLENMALETEKTDIIWHPYVVPLWDNPPNAHVGLYGANLHTSRNEIMRAVLEGIAFAEVRALEGMLELAHVEKLVLTGGGARSRVWGQIFSDLLELPVEIPEIQDAACRGAALLAGIGVGAIRDHDAASQLPIQIGRQYLPAGSAAQNRRQYQRFCDLIEANRPFWKSLP